MKRGGEDASATTANGKKSPKQGLRVNLPNGEVIQKPQAKDTFIEAIKRVIHKEGVDVEKLLEEEKKRKSKNPIISDITFKKGNYIGVSTEEF